MTESSRVNLLLQKKRKLQYENESLIKNEKNWDEIEESEEIEDIENSEKEDKEVKQDKNKFCLYCDLFKIFDV